MRNAAMMLWLEGLDPAQVANMPALQALAQEGVDLHLLPPPLVDESVCAYQILTGMGSGKIGRFDAVYPEQYAAREVTAPPPGIQGRLLPETLRTAKLAASLVDIADLADFPTMPEEGLDCAIVRIRAGTESTSEALDALVRRCADLRAAATHLLILMGVWRPTPSKLVNINDFLADIGLLEVGEPRRAADIVWPQTLAYGLGTGQVWVNLRGREPHGGVRSSQEFQDVREALIEQLTTQWRDPDTHEPVVDQVIKKETAYSGEYLFQAPDLIVVFRPEYGASPNAQRLEFDGTSVRTNEAYAGGSAGAPYARLIATGPALAGGIRATASLLDVFPSVLYLLGQPIPRQVDGQVVTAVFSRAYQQQVPIRFDEANPGVLSAEEESLIVDRLRTLGYLG